MMKDHKKRQVWYRVVTALAVVVVFVTTYMLILPAITMENKAQCGITEHKHDANCYSTHYEKEKVLDCTTETLGVHSHTDACYDAEHKLICAYADFVIHQHNASCYDEDGTLVCTIPEHKLHEHTESCYQMQKQLICTQEESAGHTHTAECYTKEKGDLVCTQEEHTHDQSCYDAEGNLICTQEEHVHGDECYQWNDVLTCTIPESAGHQHSDACYQDVKVLICEEPAELHTHTDACYQDGVLACGKVELKEHQHSDACFKEEQVLVETLVCDRVEHVHTDECYKNNKSSEAEIESSEEASSEEISSEEVSNEEAFSEEASNEEVSSEVSSEEAVSEEESTGVEEESSELESEKASSEAVSSEEESFEEVSTEAISTEEVATEEITSEEASAEEESTEEISSEEASTEEVTSAAETEEESSEEESSEAESEEADNEDVIDIWDLSTDGVLFIAYFNDGESVSLNKDTVEGYRNDNNAIQLYSASTEPRGTQFRDYITSAKVQKIVNGKWQDATEFENGDEVQVKLTYTLPEGVVTPNNKSIWYQLPDGVVPNEDLAGIVYDKSNNPIGTYEIGTNGLIQIDFYDEFATGKEITGDIFFSGKVESDNTKEDKKIEFGGSASTITIKKEKEEEVKTDINIKKEGEVSDSKDKIKYKVTISSNLGTGEKVKLDDYLTNGTYDIDSIKVTKSGNTIEKDQYQLSVDNSSETRHMKIEDLPELNPGESYEITYEVTPGERSANGELKVTNNATTNKNKSTSCNTTVKKTLISKGGKYDSDKNKIEWTVTINPDGTDLKGYTISDKLEGKELTGYKATLKYSDGRTEEITLPYTFTESTTEEVSYTISYETDVDSETPSGNVKNDATVEKDGDKYEAGSDVGYTRRDWGLQKYLDGSEKIKGQDKMVYTWKSVITLPDKKFSNLDAFVYEDTIGEPEKHSATKTELEAKIKEEIEFEYIDTEGNSKTVSGSDVDQYFSYEITYTPENSDKVSAFKITFTPKAGLDIKGKSITLKYSTNADVSDVQPGSSTTFTNTAKVNGIEKKADVDYKKPVKIQKASSVDGVLTPPSELWWETGSQYRGYTNSQAEVKLSENGYLYYRLVLNLETTENIEINDLLPIGTMYVDGSAFAAYCDVADDGTINAIEYKNDPIKTQTDIENQKADTGEDYQKLKISLTNIRSDFLNGTKGYIVVYYAVKVNDDAFGDDGKLSLTNKATWGNESADNTTNVKKFEKVVEKTGKQVVDQQGNPVDAIEYKIVINPNASDLDLEKDVLTLVDTISYTQLQSVSLNLDAIRLYYYDSAQENLCGEEISTARYQVRYDSETGKMTVVIPDELACVLVYQYNYDKGNLADKDGILDGATVSNNVKLMGESSKSDVTELKVNKSGATAHQNIEIYKVDSTDFTKKLPGAKFKLEIWKDQKWQEIGEYTSGDGENGTKLGEIELKTDADDTLAQGEIWKGYIYRLVEIEAPAGYTKMSDPYYFVRTDKNISDSKDYGSLEEAIKKVIHKISISGENIYIPNVANGLKVRKVWVDQSGKEIPEPTGSIQVRLYKTTGKRDAAEVTVSWENYKDDKTTYLVKKGSSITIQTSVHYGTFKCSDPSVTIAVKKDSKERQIFVFSGITNDCEIIGSDYYNQKKEGFNVDYTEASDIVYTGDSIPIGDVVTLNSENGWSYEWSNLEVGDDIYYYVKEVGTHSGYTVSYMNNGGIHSGEIVITNKMEEQPITLPETGGTGTYLYTLGGLLLIAGAAFLMYTNFMRKGGRRVW